MKLLLFDIDGTLLHTHGTGRDAIHDAVSQVIGQPRNGGDVDYAGRTDPLILKDLLTLYGVPEAEQADVLAEVTARYTTLMQARLAPERTTVFPGVRALLERLTDDPNVHLALLTGNFEATAYLKLRAGGLDGFFSFGAFGSDHHNRPALPPIAVQRAHDHTGRAFTGQEVVIIGDTQHDIHCGRGIGAMSVAVCTGQFGPEALAPHQPDVLFEDLTDHEAFYTHVFAA